VGSEKVAKLVRQHNAGTITGAEFAALMRQLIQRDVLRDAARVGTDFVRTEVALGITFSQIALAATSDRDKQRRNQEYAQAAYDTALRFLPRATFSKLEAKQLDSDLEELRTNLAQLGDKI
jgi:hypothetical protein